MGSKEKEYLDFVRNNPEEYPGPIELFEDNFEFNSLSYSVYRRFIELLYPGTNHFFRKTSKKNYRQCLDLRGIEVGDLSWDRQNGPRGRLCLDSGKVALNLNKVATNWTKLLVVTGDVYIELYNGTIPDIEKLDFVKKYDHLDFLSGYARQLEHLVNPYLKSVEIGDYCLKLDKLLRCLNKLNECKSLEWIHITNYKVKSAAAFKQLKQQLEQFAGRHPHARIDCLLGYNKHFRIHENVLCYCPRAGVFVKNYNLDYFFLH